MPFIKVKIPTNAQIKEVAAEYEINEESLRNFHNERCALHELLPKVLPKYIEYVYMPVANYEQRIQKQITTNKINLPITPTEKKYGVILKHIGKETLQVHYKLNLKRLTTQNIELHRERMFLNNYAVDLSIEQLVEHAQEALYPLQLQLNTKGEANQIINHLQIKERWLNNFKPKLLQYYKSDVANDVLLKLDNFLTNVNHYFSALHKNLSFNLLLFPIYRTYYSPITEGLKIYFAPIYAFIFYDVTVTLEKELSKSGKIFIRLQGNEPETALNIHQQKGTINLLYKLDKHTHEIFSITGFATTFNKNIPYKIDFELYELQN